MLREFDTLWKHGTSCCGSMMRTLFCRTTIIAVSITAVAVFSGDCIAQFDVVSQPRVSPRLTIQVPRGTNNDGLDSVTYGPQGSLILSGQWSGVPTDAEQIRVHDPLTGLEFRRIDAGHCHNVWPAFSPDGRQMVCAVG